eukprot:m.3278 g.3278  ORF g.3278 m.3278 type:complete len:55 (-) comp659_c0_seq2:80-244(-)
MQINLCCQSQTTQFTASIGVCEIAHMHSYTTQWPHYTMKRGAVSRTHPLPVQVI